MPDTPQTEIGGHVVKVSMPRMGGAYPVLEDYIVNESDPERAKQIIRAILSPDDSIESVRPVKRAAMPSDLPVGAYRPW